MPLELRVSHAEADRTDRKGSQKLNLRGAPRLAVLRLGEVRRVFRDRYGGEDFVFPDDDAGADDANILANCLAALPNVREQTIVANLLQHAPWMTESTARKIAKRSKASPTKYNADTIAEKLGITAAIRTRLELNTIGAIDEDAAARKQKRKEKDAATKRQARRAKGCKPREEYLAGSKSRQKPWEAEGIKERAWYKRQAKAKKAAAESAQVRPQYIEGYPFTADGPVHHAEQGRGLEAAPVINGSTPQSPEGGLCPGNAQAMPPSRASLSSVPRTPRPLRTRHIITEATEVSANVQRHRG